MNSPWAPLMEMGLQMLQALAPTNPTGTLRDPNKIVNPRVFFVLYEKTGQTYFKIPAPSSEKIQKFANALQELLSAPGGT